MLGDKRTNKKLIAVGGQIRIVRTLKNFENRLKKNRRTKHDKSFTPLELKLGCDFQES